MPTVYELGLIVGAAVGGGAIGSVATRFIRRREVSTVVALILAAALAAVVTVSRECPLVQHHRLLRLSSSAYHSN